MQYIDGYAMVIDAVGETLPLSSRQAIHNSQVPDGRRRRFCIVSAGACCRKSHDNDVLVAATLRLLFSVRLHCSRHEHFFLVCLLVRFNHGLERAELVIRLRLPRDLRKSYRPPLSLSLSLALSAIERK